LQDIGFVMESDGVAPAVVVEVEDAERRRRGPAARLNSVAGTPPTVSQLAKRYVVAQPVPRWLHAASN